MKSPNFKAEKIENQVFYNQINSLSITDSFKWIDDIYSIINFSNTHIIAMSDSKIKKFTPYEFEGYIYHGFIKILITKKKISFTSKFEINKPAIEIAGCEVDKKS